LKDYKKINLELKKEIKDRDKKLKDLSKRLKVCLDTKKNLLFEMSEKVSEEIKTYMKIL